MSDTPQFRGNWPVRDHLRPAVRELLSDDEARLLDVKLDGTIVNEIVPAWLAFEWPCGGEA
jgi:hypothetical protein